MAGSIDQQIGAFGNQMNNAEDEHELNGIFQSAGNDALLNQEKAGAGKHKTGNRPE